MPSRHRPRSPDDARLMPDRIDMRPSEGRLPPGQCHPEVAGARLQLRAVRQPRDLAVRGERRRRSAALADLGRAAALPRRETVCDIHCVTRWSRYDNVFAGRAGPDDPGAGEGSAGSRLRPGPRRAGVHHQYPPRGSRPAGQPARAHATTGEPLTPEHGGPVRLLAPHPYLWKSAKWVTGSSSWRRTIPAFGSRTDITCAAIRGPRNATAAPIRCECGAVRDEAAHKSCLWGPTRFSCLTCQNRPDVRRPRHRRNNGSRIFFGRRTACPGRSPGPSTPAIRAVCIRLAEMVADQRHYLAPLPEPQESERRTVLTIVADRLRAGPGHGRGSTRALKALEEVAAAIDRQSGPSVATAQTEWITTAIRYLEIVRGTAAGRRATRSLLGG